MKRLVLDQLIDWKNDSNRKPLLIRGARQVGKTYLVRKLGETFKNYIEINFEMSPDLRLLFKEDLNPKNVIKKIEIILNENIIPGETLLFFDEIQSCPEALTSLRYFYEHKPDLHVIGAGSLIEFLLEEIGMPVGRIRSLFLYPINLKEFLIAKGEGRLLEILESHNPENKLDEIYHRKLLRIMGEYLAIGGMPEVVNQWLETGDYRKVQYLHTDLIETFRQDFNKYAKSHQIRYIEMLFNSIPVLMGNKFKYSNVTRELKSRDISPALDLLIKAGLIYPIYHTSANGIPLGSEKKKKYFKLIFLDIGLAQRILNINSGNWIVDPLKTLKNNGKIAEAFLGQELCAYSDPFIKKELFYWVREKRSAMAEVDYLEVLNNNIVPLEVKSGLSGKAKSMKIFLKEKACKFGIIFSQRNFSTKNNILYYPLYSCFKIFEQLNNQKYKSQNYQV